MALDSSIPLGVQQVNPMQSLASVVGVAGGVQNLRNAQVQNQALTQDAEQGRITLQERKNMQQVLSDPSNYTGDDGKIDMNKALPIFAKAAPTTWSDYASKLLTAQKQSTDAARAVNEQTDENRSRIGQALYGVDPKSTSPDEVNQVLDQLGSQYKGMSLPMGLAKAHFNALIQQGDIQGAYAALQKVASRVLPQQTQQAMATPEGVQVANGQTSKIVNVKPGASIPQGATIPGTATQMQLPPTTPTFNQETQTPGYVGPTGGGSGYAGGSRDAADKDRLHILQEELKHTTNPDDKAALQREISHVQGNKGFVPSGPSLGQAGNVENNFNEMNRHFGGLNDQSSGAPLVQALTSNIKSLAASAVTGTESGKKSYVTGLLNALHLGGQATGDLQKDTDLLEKNLAQLNLSTPASTDAARTLVTAARPHSTMSEGAIKEAADQIASQVKANMAMRNALSSYKMMGDVQGYAATRQKLEQVADPRVWQFESLPDKASKQAFMAKLPAKDRAELLNKAQQLTQMGLVK